MEDIGDWIYVLAILVATVASLINSMRKKAQQQAATHNQPREIIVPRTDEEDDVWDDFIPKREEQPLKQPQQFKRSVEPFVNFINEGQPTFRTEATDAMFLEEEATPVIPETLPSGPDEWRKAFIYNEIFARKNG